MVFNSLKFLIFFVTFFLVYWFIGKKGNRWQNVFILLFSYVFYGIAEWRMIPLLAIATGIFYWLGIKIDEAQDDRIRSRYASFGVVLGLGTLLYFKYFNFFIASFVKVFEAMGLHTNICTMKILMPLGVSYFTFKLISYVLEVERRRMSACRDGVNFAVFISFFPTIMAGPIDRPNHFLPQLELKREFKYDQAVDGCRQILWGLFKKVAIADQLNGFIDATWSDIPNQNASTLVLVALLYTVQMYNDFSGYSDMAIGISKLMGIKISRNFNYPFFATNIAEFWKRWHISLTSWLTDYVFIPLNIRFRDWGKIGIIFAIIINMVLVGMWHGADWKYAVFGLYQGILFIPVILSGKVNKKQKLNVKYGLPVPIDALKMIGICFLYTFGAILFRAPFHKAIYMYYLGIMNSSILSAPNWGTFPMIIYVFIFMVLVLEWVHRNDEYPLCMKGKIGLAQYSWLRYIIYLILICIVLVFSGEEQQFIYFQF